MVLEFKVLLYKFADLSCVLEVDTVSNGRGISPVAPLRECSNGVRVRKRLWGCSASTSAGALRVRAQKMTEDDGAVP